MRTVFLAVSMVALVACAADEAAEPAELAADITGAEASPAVPVAKATSAEMTETRVTKSKGKCKVDVVTQTAKVMSAAATKKINAALAFDVDARLQGEDCTRYALSLTGSYAVKFNARNVLAVAYTENYDAEGAAHPSQNLFTWNFDLATGDAIALTSAVDATGRAAIAAACKKTLAEGGLQFDEECESAVRELEFRGEPIYSVESGGLRIHPVDLPYAAWSAAAKGALAPWSELKGHITNATLKSLVP